MSKSDGHRDVRPALPYKPQIFAVLKDNFGDLELSH